MKKKRNYGLKLRKREPQDYIFGSSLPLDILQANGDWTDFLPIKEFQNLNRIEPYACVAYSILNCVEILIKRQYGEEVNYSDRFLAYISGTKDLKGNDPHTVAEFLRKAGVVGEKDWPFDSSITSFEKYYAPLPPKLLELAREFNDRWEFKHEFVDDNSESISLALKCSPLLISVPAWHYRRGKFYRPKGVNDNHATTLFYERAGEFRRVFDSYETPVIKDLEWGLMPKVIKRFYVKKKPYEQQLSIIQKILNLIGQMIGLMPKPQPIVSPEPPQPLVEPVVEPTREKILKEAKAWLGKDASPVNQAPKELACAESVCHILRQVGIQVPLMVSTIELHKWLKKSPLFKSTTEPKPGNIILTPTGTGTLTGHTGIFGVGGKIMSNDSDRGMWLENYTIDGWVNRWRKQGRMPIYYFEAK